MSKTRRKSYKFLLKKLRKVIYSGKWSMNYAYPYFMYQDGDIDAVRYCAPLVKGLKGNELIKFFNNLAQQAM